MVSVICSSLSSIAPSWQALLSAGAHRVSVTGLPAFGCTPAVRQTLNITNGGCSALVDSLFDLHNRHLSGQLALIRAQFPSAVVLEGRFFRDTIRYTLHPRLAG